LGEHRIPQAAERITFLDYLIVIFKRKKLIAGLTAAFAVVSIIVSLLLPKIYMGETHILPSQQNGSNFAAQFLGQLDSLGIAGNAVGIKSVNDLYMGLLQSNVVLDRVIERFGLMKVYDEKYRQDARHDLLNVLSLQNDKKSGIISIGVEDPEPKRAADMANAFAEELKHLTQKIAVTEAAQRRLFFEEERNDARKNLLEAEEAMKGYQEKTGAIEIKEQTKAAIEASSMLRAQIAAKEVQLKVLRSHATPQNPDIQRTVEELQGLREQLAKLETGHGSKGDAILPTGNVPAAGTGYMRRLRDVKYAESLFDIMAKQYEMAKIDESHDASVIQVIDKAADPEKKVRPKRALIVLFATATGFLFSIVVAFVLEFIDRVKNNPRYEEKLAMLKSMARYK